MKNIEFYKDKLDTETSTIKQVGWENELKAIKRYERIATMVNDYSLVVDYGCGLGELSKYLSHGYIGIDVQTEYVNEARIIHPDKIFMETDGNGHIPLCDVCVNVGVWTLNNDMSNDNFWDKIKDEVVNIMDSTDLLIVNGFHNGCNEIDPKLYYHDMANWFRLCNDNGFIMQTEMFSKYEFIMTIQKQIW